MNLIREYVIQTPVAAFIFAITLATSLMAFQDDLLKKKFILHPWSFVRDKNYYTLITSGLIHANFLHLGMNLFAFYLFGFQLNETMVLAQQGEMREMINGPDPIPLWVPIAIGHLKYFILYFSSMVVSDFTTILRFKDRFEYRSLGASGAISGVVISMILFYPQTLRIWGIPGWLFAILFLAGSSLASRFRTSNVNHEAHLWGGIGGAVFTLMLYPSLFPRIMDSIRNLF